MFGGFERAMSDAIHFGTPKFEYERYNLPEILWKQAQNGINTDVDIKVEDKTLKCHKFILTTVSKVFATMLSSTLVEGETNVIEIDAFTPECVENFLKFLYTSNFEAHSLRYSTSMVCELLMISDYYDIEGLKGPCIHVLWKTMQMDIKIEVFVKILDVCFKINCEVLLEKAKELLQKKKAHILKSEEFKLFKIRQPLFQL